MTDITLRPAAADDAELLFRIYAATRAEELSPVPWTADEKEAFLRAQFEAQAGDWAERFPEASFDVILAGGEPVGRLYVDRRDDEIRLVDIALLPEHRRRGIGSHLLRRILSEADAAGLPVRIHVERQNPAMGLYRRLGFTDLADRGVYVLMERRPGRRTEAP